MPTMRQLLNAAEVQQLFDVDRSTVYRMAADGRLPAVRVGRQWRFPAEEITSMLSVDRNPAFPKSGSRRVDPEAARQVLDLTAPLLGVMMVVTDLTGTPITPVVNPSPWMKVRLEDAGVIADCVAEWGEMASSLELVPRFAENRLGFECAHSLIRSGSELVGMVFAGGISNDRSDCFRLGESERIRVLDTLPKLAAHLSTVGVASERNQAR